MYQMMGVFAEFERAIIRERLVSGLARARAGGIALGRPALEDADAARKQPDGRGRPLFVGRGYRFGRWPRQESDGQHSPGVALARHHRFGGGLLVGQTTGAGGIGVSGGTADQDESCAQTGIDAVEHPLK
jgi:Haem-degrading/Resolvase, N terminal domain